MARQDRILGAVLPLAPERYDRGLEQEFRREIERAMQDIGALATAAAVGDHGDLTGLGDDDHSLYLLASDATSRAAFAAAWLDLTDGGASVLHKHDHGGMDGLADDDHTLYLLASGARGLSGNWDVGAYSVTMLSLLTDTINEETAAAGVTIDSLLIKDGEVGFAADKALYAVDSSLNALILEADTAGSGVNSVVLMARNMMEFICDSNNSGTTQRFAWGTDAATFGAATIWMILKNGALSVDTINELTSAAGVTIDGTLLKDNGVYIGVNDTTQGNLYLYGHATGSAEGGQIYFYFAADYDAVYDYMFIDAYADDLRFGRTGAVLWTLTNVGGWYAAGATGGDKGVGTVNALGLYVNGAALIGAKSVLQFDTAGTQLSSSATQYFGPSYVNATEARAHFRIPLAGTLSNMYVKLGDPPGTEPAARTLTVMINGVADTTLQIILTGTGYPNTLGEDTVGTVSVNAGDTISIRSTVTSSPAVSRARVTMMFTPSA